MLSRTTLPISRTTARLIITRSCPPISRRTFHTSYVYAKDTKAAYATIAPEKQATTITIPQPTKEDKPVTKVDEKPVEADIVEKRDFYWRHPVYTREEYEAVKVLPPHPNPD